MDHLIQRPPDRCRHPRVVVPDGGADLAGREIQHAPAAGRLQPRAARADHEIFGKAAAVADQPLAPGTAHRPSSLPGTRDLVHLACWPRQHTLGHLPLEQVEPALLVCGALVGAGQVYELVRHEAVPQDERHSALPIAQPKYEAFERSAALGTRERVVDAITADGDGTRDQLEGVPGARAPERRFHDDLPPLARTIRIEQRERELEDLDGVRDPSGGARPVVAHDVLDREREQAPSIDDLDRGSHPLERYGSLSLARHGGIQQAAALERSVKGDGIALESPLVVAAGRLA